MEVNFFALVEMTRLALPLLKQGVKPIVVNVSSILGHRGVPHSSEYCASKFAVQGFSEVDPGGVHPAWGSTCWWSVPARRKPSSSTANRTTAEPSWPKHKPTTAKRVAQAVVKAIRLGRHEIIPYRWGRVLCWLNRLSPSLMDSIMARYS